VFVARFSEARFMISVAAITSAPTLTASACLRGARENEKGTLARPSEPGGITSDTLGSLAGLA